MTAISSNKKVCVRFSGLRLCSKHRRVRELTSSTRLPNCSSSSSSWVVIAALVWIEDNLSIWSLSVMGLSRTIFLVSGKVTCLFHFTDWTLFLNIHLGQVLLKVGWSPLQWTHVIGWKQAVSPWSSIQHFEHLEDFLQLFVWCPSCWLPNDLRWLGINWDTLTFKKHSLISLGAILPWNVRSMVAVKILFPSFVIVFFYV